ncbi:MAG TPA: DUF4382 domain-containing protein [Nitrospira sp.]|nr:DUF4382 domain-containing protein [Nitrospira sp.]
MKKLAKQCKLFIWLIGLLVAGLVTGCGSSDSGGGSAPGTLSVSLTDAPACGFDEVNVTVSKVRIHQSDSASDNAAGWTDITLKPARKINLLNLNDPTKPNFVLENLGETSLAAGHYTQLRLVLVENSNNPNTPVTSLDNYVVLSNTKAPEPLVTPSAIRTGVKLIHQFDVASGQRVDLLLDFDACHSIVKTGSDKYILKPVIKVIPYALNGIQGFVDKNSFLNQSLVGKNVVVSAQINGEIVRATVVNTDTGKFFLAHLDTANHYDVVITADDHATAVIANVPVDNAPNITIVSTDTAPIPLNSSGAQGIGGTVTLKNPALDPSDSILDDGTVTVTAQQTLNSGPTVTVKSVVATVLDSGNPPTPPGDYEYNMTLPVAAPSLGLFGTLPITLSTTVPDQSAVAKIYTVKGSAEVDTTTGTTVYATQNPLPSAKDISILANQTQDFTLTP